MAQTVLSMMAFQKFDAMPQPSLQKVKNDMMKKIKLKADQEKLNKLSEKLNEIVRDNQFETSKIPEQILDRIPQIVNKGEEALQGLEISKSMKVSTAESNAAWAEFSKKTKEYKSKLANGINDLALAKEIEDVQKVALSLQGQLSTLSGQVFESLLQVLVPLIQDDVETKALNSIDQLIGILDKKTEIKTQGDVQEKISLKIDGKTVRVSSKGKIDVQTEAPFLGEKDLLNISAKNYGKLRDIHLLSKGSVVGLISQWPTSNATKNYYYNALGVYNPFTYLQEARLLFAIQALAGRGSQEMANVLILNIQSRKKNPIQVISIKSLLESANVMPETEGNAAFKMKYHSLPAYEIGEKRDKDEFRNRIKKVTLDTTLNKNYLTMKYIRQLK